MVVSATWLFCPLALGQLLWCSCPFIQLSEGFQTSACGDQHSPHCVRESRWALPLAPASPTGSGGVACRSRWREWGIWTEAPSGLVVIWTDWPCPSLCSARERGHKARFSFLFLFWKLSMLWIKTQVNYPQCKREWKILGPDSDRKPGFRIWEGDWI